MVAKQIFKVTKVNRQGAEAETEADATEESKSSKPEMAKKVKAKSPQKQTKKAPSKKQAGAAKKKGELKVFSTCKKFALSPNNEEYLIHIEAVNVLNSIKSKVYPTFADLENDLIPQLNADSNLIQYKAQMTSKYVVVKCTCCKLFAYWFQNTDKVDVEALMKNGNKNFNLVLFRSINQNHVLAQHSQIEF